MDKRQYLLFCGWCYSLTVIVLLAIFAFQKIDDFGFYFGIAFITFLTYKSYSCFSAIKNTREEDRVFAPSTDTSKTEKISFYNKTLWVGIPAFIILSVWTYGDLTDLESGIVESVSIWEPIHLLYNMGGYWLAILATPLLGILSVILILRKIKELKNIKQI
jgi:hypothetical protein